MLLKTPITLKVIVRVFQALAYSDPLPPTGLDKDILQLSRTKLIFRAPFPGDGVLLALSILRLSGRVKFKRLASHRRFGFDLERFPKLSFTIFTPE